MDSSARRDSPPTAHSPTARTAQGGFESMSNIPHYMKNGRSGVKLGNVEVRVCDRRARREGGNRVRDDTYIYKYI